MNVTLIVVTALMAAVTLAAILWIAASAGEGPVEDDGQARRYGHGDATVVTVRSACLPAQTDGTCGPPPRMLDEDDETDLMPAGPEAARDEFPDLYEEYMDQDTSAARRYEIADAVCDAGFVLPWQRDLHDEYVRETAQAPAKDGAAHTDTGTHRGRSLRDIGYRVFEGGPLR